MALVKYTPANLKRNARLFYGRANPDVVKSIPENATVKDFLDSVLGVKTKYSVAKTDNENAYDLEQIMGKIRYLAENGKTYPGDTELISDIAQTEIADLSNEAIVRAYRLTRKYGGQLKDYKFESGSAVEKLKRLLIFRRSMKRLLTRILIISSQACKKP